MTTLPYDPVVQSRAAAYDEIYRLSQVKHVTIESFERWACYFLDAPPGECGHLNGNEICFALSRIGVGQLAGKHVLDYCCGVGRSSIYFALRGARVSAFDASALAIEVAKKSARISGVADQIDFRTLDAQNLEYATGSFDAAYCQSSLHIVIDYPRCATELARVLKPGGRAVFCEEPLGHNPLLALIRAMRRRCYRGCGGRELTYADIQRFGQPFVRINITHFNLLSQVKTLVGRAAYRPVWRAMLSRLDAFDRWVLRAIPVTRRWAGKVVVEFVVDDGLAG